MATKPPPEHLPGHPISGVRYRAEERTRTVTTELDGQPRQTQKTYEVLVPQPPRDWDHILLRAVTGAAVAATAVSVAWTTASIGQLLALTAPAAVAYAAAGVFDFAWITCLVLQWLDRYDPKRARAAAVVGWFALGIAVAAVIAHGSQLDQLAAGIVGAGISVIAKGLWTLVLRHFAVTLGEGTAGWLQQRREEINAQRALSGQLRRLHDDEAYTAAVYGPAAGAARALTSADTAARGQDTGHEAEQDTGRDTDTTAQEDRRPVFVTAQDAPAGQDARPDTGQQETGQQDRTPARTVPARAVMQPRTGDPSVKDTIVTAVRKQGVDIEDRDALLAAVREVHGEVKPDTFIKSRNRARKALEKGEGFYA
ncbi:hypothetical protein RM572_00640 [Streptomyces sp. DSM 42041]|uniref:Protein transporter Sec31 n=1 Tax=Streptomyces hazeniae TaxID=3075538 RepID=A0ABU2NNQ4_9ACTN|nr:hypothetical protein [Streptomyces sp. DSM 42041]MDT0377283.1 hypothetical protein [Streptomyces sp. DSM 42041]